MKGNIILLLTFYVYNSLGQNVINPYINDPAPSINQFRIFPNSWIDPNLNQIPYDLAFRPFISGYGGEYEIKLDRHPWEYYPNIGNGYGLMLSFDIETVSFPFIPGCAFTSSPCADNGIIRDLGMPIAAYANNSWGSLTNLSRNRLFNTNFQALVSESFAENIPIGNNNSVFPHSILKHTINVHCQPYFSTIPYGPIIYSFSWYYDNTRGRMKYYPFCSCNCSSTCTELDYDVCFAPELLLNYYVHTYDESDPTIIQGNGSLDYFRWSDINSIPNCNLSLAVSSPESRPNKNRENKLKPLNLMANEKIKIYRNTNC